MSFFGDFFGQQVPKGPVSQLQNCASTSSLPPFIVDFLTFKIYPSSNLFFNVNFRGCCMANFISWAQWAETAVVLGNCELSKYEGKAEGKQ